MITTLEIPDPLYRKLAAKSAQLGADVASLTLGYYRQLVNEAPLEPEAAPTTQGSSPPELAERMAALETWFQMCDAAMAKAPAGPGAREHLEAGRNRLES